MNYEYYSSLALVTSVVVYTAGHVRPRRRVGRRPHACRAEEPPAERELVIVGAGGRRRRVERPTGSSRRGGPSRPTPGAPTLRVEQFGRIGVALTVIGFLLSLTGVVLRGLAAGRAPWGNMFEFTTQRHGLRRRRPTC